MQFLGAVGAGLAGLLSVIPLLLVLALVGLLLRRKRRAYFTWRLRRTRDTTFWNHSSGAWQARAVDNVFGAVAIACALLMTAACVPGPTEPQPISVCGGVGSCGGNVGQPSPSPSPSASPLPGCPAVVRVTVGFSGAGGRTTTRVGTGEVLDVTPRDASGAEVPAHCHGATVQWSLTGSAVCQLSGDTAGFNPHVTCSTPGSFTATATVAPPGGTASTIFTVTP